MYKFFCLGASRIYATFTFFSFWTPICPKLIEVGIENWYADACVKCPLTVKHILVECVDLKDVRNKHFIASSIKDLFDNIEAHKIIDFIKETRFYKQL